MPGIYPRLRTSTAAFGPASRNGCPKSMVYVVALYPLYSPPRADAYLAILAGQNVSPLAVAMHLLVENVLGRLLASLAPFYVLAAVAIVLAGAAHTLAGALGTCSR